MAVVPFMPFYVADYQADAGHLTTLEHGAYLLLIMAYWQRGEALPDDSKKLARIAGLQGANWRKVEPAIREFFVTRDGKLFHRRIEQELQHLRDKSLKNRKGGLARAKQMQSERSAGAEKTLSHTDADADTDTEEDKKEPFKPPKGVSKPDDVSADVWEDFKRHRRRNGTITDRVIAGFRREAEIAGWTLEQAMNESITQGWRGFKAEYVKGRNYGTQSGSDNRDGIAKALDRRIGLDPFAGEVGRRDDEGGGEGGALRIAPPSGLR